MEKSKKIVGQWSNKKRRGEGKRRKKLQRRETGTKSFMSVVEKKEKETWSTSENERQKRRKYKGVSYVKKKIDDTVAYSNLCRLYP